MMRWHKLRTGLAMQINKLRKQKLDAALLDDPPHILGGLGERSR
jgi:hypothetical protein